MKSLMEDVRKQIMEEEDALVMKAFIYTEAEMIAELLHLEVNRSMSQEELKAFVAENKPKYEKLMNFQ